MILSLDFSIVDASGEIEDIRSRFNQICNISLRGVTWRYQKYLGDSMEIDLNNDVSINFC